MIEHLSAFQASYGKAVPPIKRLMLLSSEEWETFTEEWLDTKKDQYLETERIGGAGDKGRDVIAYVTDKRLTNYVWDCYQCKHYDHVIAPNEVYKELGKILYYTYINDYPIPRAYYFVAPMGCGTSLSKLLQSPKEMMNSIINNWDKHCKDKITDKESIELEGDFLSYVEKFNYSIFDKVTPKDIVDQHKKHPNHLITFGGGLPPRPVLNISNIPQSIQQHESVYISQILLAYGSDCSQEFDSFNELPIDSLYRDHFNKTRINFHYAEQLRTFSRDTLPVGVFESFQDQVLDGVDNLLYKTYASGFDKVNSVESHASIISISGSPLWDSSQIKDRKGICHQLVNDGRITWIKK